MKIGEKLGPYEIVALIGKGGMGEVYRAHDSRLKRDVAIKISAERFSERFEREALAVAALNHPNICTLYDVGPNYLVMEYIEGESPKGPYPLEEALRIARQIADALEAAHEKLIVHRDLKPANIKIRPDGTVKVLDFGLAKIHEEPQPPSAAGSPENSPTLTMGGLTDAGTILGSPAYMSPEQARGKKADKRADIWAFGVVLYEMLTGERPFQGEDMTDILMSVVKEQPDLSRVPVEVRKLLQICLEKDRRKRLQDIGDWRLALEEAPVQQVAPPPPPPPSRFRVLGWIVAATLALALGAALFLLWPRPSTHPLMRFTDDLGAQIALIDAEGPALAISPDGSRLAYVSRDSGGKTHLSLRLLNSSKSTILDGTEGAGAPFFSPDSRWIAFFADQKLKKISVEGGAAVTLCDVGLPRGGSWGEDGNILFANQRTPLLRVSSSGGTPRSATDLKNGEVTNRFPQLLPGGESFLFTASLDNNSWEGATIEVQSVKSGDRKTLVQGGYFGRYLATSNTGGYLLYLHGGAVFAAPMDLKHRALTGPAVPVLDDVSGHAGNGFADLDVTATGTLVYITGRNTPGQSLFWLDATGDPQPLPAAPAQYAAPRSSPDGTRIAVLVSESSGTNLSVYEWAQNRMTRLTFLKSVGIYPTWTPDGKHLAFPSDSQELSGPGIYWIRADGAGEPQRLAEGQNLVPYSFSPDGTRLAYFQRGGANFGIWTLPLDLADAEHPKAGKPETFLKSKSDLRNPAFSPDGRWIAYNSWETGNSEIYVRPFRPSGQSPGGKWQVSTAGGGGPSHWSRSGRELLYTDFVGQIRVAPYTAKGDSFALGAPRLWSQKGQLPGLNLDLMPDGKRFIAVMPTAAATPAAPRTHVTFLLNFADELRRRAPAEK